MKAATLPDSFHLTSEKEPFMLTNTSRATGHCHKLPSHLPSQHRELLFSTFLHIPRHFLFLQHLPRCSHGAPIQKWSALETANSRTNPNALNVKQKASALPVATISSVSLLNSNATLSQDSHLPQKPKAARAPLRHKLPEGLADLRRQVPARPPHGTLRSEGTRGLCEAEFAPSGPRAPAGGHPHLATQRCPAHPGAVRRD